MTISEGDRPDPNRHLLTVVLADVGGQTPRYWHSAQTGSFVVTGLTRCWPDLSRDTATFFTALDAVLTQDTVSPRHHLRVVRTLHF